MPQATCGPLPANSIVVSGISPVPGVPAYSMSVVAQNDGVSNSIQHTKMWDSAKTKLLASELAQLGKKHGAYRRPVLLDIGANLGWFSLLAAASGNARVISIEASEENAALFQHSMCINAPHLAKHITLHKVGVGALSADCTLIARRVNIASPSAVCGHGDGQHAAAFMNTWSASAGLGFADYIATGSMRMTRIDDILSSQRVDVIKIDVEGNELEVCKGWEALFDRSPPSLVVTEFVPSLIAYHSNTTEPLDYLRFFLRRGYMISDEVGTRNITTEKALQRWSRRAPWMSDLIIRKIL